MTSLSAVYVNLFHMRCKIFLPLGWSSNGQFHYLLPPNFYLKVSYELQTCKYIIIVIHTSLAMYSKEVICDSSSNTYCGSMESLPSFMWQWVWIDLKSTHAGQWVSVGNAGDGQYWFISMIAWVKSEQAPRWCDVCGHAYIRICMFVSDGVMHTVEAG